MTTKNDGPGKDDVRAGDASQPKKPYATIELKATQVEIKDAKSPAAASSAQSSPTPSATGAQASSAASTAAKPGDAAKTTDKPSGSGGTQPAAAAASSGKPADTKPAATSSAAPSSGVKPSAAAPPAAATQRRSGGIGSFLSHMAAGIAGGFLALLGADTLGPHMAELGLPIGPSLKGPATADLQNRIAALEQAPKSSPAQGPELAQKLAAAEARLSKIDELTKSVASVTEAQAKLASQSETLAAAVAKQTSAEDAASRVAKLEERLSTMAAAAENNPSAGRIPQLAAITGKVSDLETTVNTQMSAIRKSVAEQIESRVALVAEGAEAAKSGTVRMDRDVSALKAETAKLGTRMETIKADGDRLADTLRVVQADTGGLRSALDGLKGDVQASLKTLARPTDVAAAVSPVASKLSSLEQNLQSVVKSEEDRKANAERIVLSLELGNLKRTLDRGQKYATELAEVKKAAGGKIDLTALERYKDQGVATASDLAREFRSMTGAILDAESDPADGSVVDRLWAGAKSVVRVRKVSHTSDDKSAEAIVGRMDQALKDNRLGDVIEQSKLLPAKAAQPAQAWLAKVDARAAVDRALATIEGQLKSSLTGTSSK